MYQDILEELFSHASVKNTKGQQRFGITPKTKQLGVPMPVIRTLAKRIGKDHELAKQLWGSGIHDARILASLVAVPDQVNGELMESWVKGFDSWDVCDQTCSNLFDRTSLAWDKALEWGRREEEFVRRAGFVLMATLSVHDKKAPDEKFKKFYPLLIKYVTDERNFVRKAVNWAIRQIGKRNLVLNKHMVALSEKILETHPDSKSARWIAKDAIRELASEKVLKKLN